TRGVPAVIASTASAGLFFGHEHGSFGRPCGSSFHCSHIRRADAKEMVNSVGEDRPLYKWRKAVRQKQVGNFLQAVPRGWMAGNLHSRGPQLLYESPNL